MNLSLDKLDATLAALGMQPRPQHETCVVSPAVMQQLRAQSRDTSIAIGLADVHFMGVPVHEKPGQKADCYAFKNAKLARDYLKGRITEEALEKYFAARDCAASAAMADPGTIDDFLAARVADAETKA